MLELDHEEREILVDLLETTLADLRMEIGAAAPVEQRNVLKKRKHIIEKTVAFLRRENTFQTAPAIRGAPKP